MKGKFIGRFRFRDVDQIRRPRPAVRITRDEHPGKLAAYAAKMRDFWAKRIAEGKLT